MLLVKFLNKVFKTGGFVLEDANGISDNVGNDQQERRVSVSRRSRSANY